MVVVIEELKTGGGFQGEVTDYMDSSSDSRHTVDEMSRLREDKRKWNQICDQIEDF